MIRGSAPSRRPPEPRNAKRQKAAAGRYRPDPVTTVVPGDAAPRRSLWAWGGEILVLTLIAVGIVVAVVGVASGGWQVQPILSGSMRPGFPVGGVVVAERMPLSELHVRDVLIFHPPSEPSVYYVHRVISLRREGSTVDIRTQGDANLYPDPWTLRLHGRSVYVARFTLPLLGYAAVWVHSLTGRRTMLVVALVLVGALAGLFLHDGNRRRRAGARGCGVSAAGPDVSENPVASGDGATDSCGDTVRAGEDGTPLERRPTAFVTASGHENAPEVPRESR